MAPFKNCIGLVDEIAELVSNQVQISNSKLVCQFSYRLLFSRTTTVLQCDHNNNNNNNNNNNKYGIPRIPQPFLDVYFSKDGCHAVRKDQENRMSSFIKMNAKENIFKNTLLIMLSSTLSSSSH